MLTNKTSLMSGNPPTNKRPVMFAATCASLPLLTAWTMLYSVRETVKNGFTEFARASLRATIMLSQIAPHLLRAGCVLRHFKSNS